MVRYDEDGVVAEARTGFTAEMEPDYRADRGDRRHLTLAMLPYEFRARFKGSTYEESLLVSLPEDWPPVAPDQCRFLFVPNWLASRSAGQRELYIDDYLALVYFVDEGRVYEFVLPPGSYRASIEIPVYKGDRFEAEWICSAGQTVKLYDHIGLGPRPDRERWHSGYGPVGSLDLDSGADLISSGRKLVIFHSGLVERFEGDE